MRRGGTVQWDDDQNKNFMVSVVVSENFSGKSLLEQKIIIEGIQDKIPSEKGNEYVQTFY